MLTAHDYQALAIHLVREHGSVALTYADRAVAEMEALGEDQRAAAWRLLRTFVNDVLSGAVMMERPLTLH